MKKGPPTVCQVENPVVRNVAQGGEPIPPQEEGSKAYIVRKEYFDEFVNRLGIIPTWDCFADEETAQCARYFTNVQEALVQKWDEREILWLNPPWELWETTATRLINSPCTAICIFPAWKKDWVRKLVHVATKRLYVEEGTRLFEYRGRKCQGTRWGTWVVRIDGDFRPDWCEIGAYDTVFIPRWRTQKVENGEVENEALTIKRWPRVLTPRRRRAHTMPSPFGFWISFREREASVKFLPTKGTKSFQWIWIQRENQQLWSMF